MSAAQIPVPQKVRRKLSAVRSRGRLFSFLAGTALAAAVFCGLLLAALLLDWLVTPFETGLRVGLTTAVLLLGAAAWIAWGLRPVLSRLSLSTVAGLVDAVVPELQERWTTIADRSQTSDPPAIRGSESMLRQVACEAERLDDLVEPQRIVSASAVRSRLWAVCGVLAAGAVLWLADREQGAVLWQRFWSPTQPISLTQVTSPIAGSVVPRHERVRIVGRLSGRVRSSATLCLRDESGSIAQHAMTADAANPAEFGFSVDDLAAPVEYRIRAGDGQTPWHRIDVADRPRLTHIEFRIVPPEYSRLPATAQAGLPRRTRALEGSTVEIAFTASEPLDELHLLLPDAATLGVSASADGVYRFSQVLTEDLSFSPQLVSRHGLTNEAPPSCQILVYRDEFPTVAIASPESDYVVRPDDEIQIAFTAHDDFGIARAELVVTDAAHPEDAPLKVVEIPLGDQQHQAEIQSGVALDLKEFDLKHGANLSYAVRVYDTKDSRGESGRDASEKAAQPADAHDGKSDSKTAGSPPAQSEDAEQRPAADGQLAQAGETQKNTAAASHGDPQTSQSSPSRSGQTSKGTASSKSDDEQLAARQDGAPRPGDDMQRRQLNLGQCSSCRPMNLKIDEWAGSFAGQQREKLEIAIEEFLARMDAALRNAEHENQQVFEAVSNGAAWNDQHVVGARKASGHLSEASDVALELATTSAGTPYAFMGLQLAEIDERHIVPAQSILQSAAQAPDAERPAALQKSLFHIRRARELLARLSRTYEGVRINHQIAEAMTHVKKMHQVFIEDTFKLLGESRPVLNPKQRKYLELEIDEEFRNQLKALLEKKRDVQAELAKVLAENPDLLRRFMSQARVDADSLRDQLTLLAGRQQEQSTESQPPAEASGDSSQRLGSRQARHAQEAIDIAQYAALMFENFGTWLPRDLKLTDATIEPVHRLYQQLATGADRLAASTTESLAPTAPPPSSDAADDADAAAVAAPNHGRRVYDVLRELEVELPKLTAGRPAHAKLTTHVTNRLAEVAKLTTRVSGWVRKSEAFAENDQDLAAQIDQTNLTNDTAELTNKIENLQSWMAGLTDEIGNLSDELLGTLDELLVQQATAEEAFAAHVVPKARRQQALAVESFANAERQFDQLLDAIIAHLDSLPVNTRPSLDGAEAPSLDELLALLEQEKLAAEGLGIPCCRPNNLSIVRDWLSPGKGSGGGMGATMAAGALSQTQGALQRAGRLQKSAEDRQRQLQAALAAEAAQQGAGGRRPVNPRWNTLQSKLDDSLRQARGQSPPPKYRSAIERYFEVISGVTAGDVTE